MKTKPVFILLWLVAISYQTVLAREPVIKREIPNSDRHPGNIFTQGERITIKIPERFKEEAASWRLLDDSGQRLSSGSLQKLQSKIKAGQLGVGWYRLEFIGKNGKLCGWTSAAVIAKLSAPVPQDSPVCLDGATAWFAKDDPAKQETFARLAALAGANWFRDRMKWGEIEPAKNKFAGKTTYDTSATIESRCGLKVLQVFHDIPGWATENGESRGRFVRDLRILYKFCRTMAQRFKGRVQAWEPWNEANVPNFGGHSVDEMCSFQKAAYLGFKAGDPGVIVCSNAYTGTPTQTHAEGVIKNETWSYFDTFNIHTYDLPDSYERLWAPVRKAACGRPIWVTESDRGMKYVTGEPWCDLSRKGEIQKARFMAQSYASSLYAGAVHHFHFILGHYYEKSNGVQFGLLRLDMTPRPSYVALAAIGRLLAGAKCLGRWNIKDKPYAHVYAFQALPDGKKNDVLVAWAEQYGDWNKRGKTRIPWKLPAQVSVLKVFDYLGRLKGKKIPGELTGSPVFVLLPPGEAKTLTLSHLKPSAYRKSVYSKIVLQLQMPAAKRNHLKKMPWALEYVHKIKSGEKTGLPFFAYNFSNKKIKGKIFFEEIPAGWKLKPREWEVEIKPMDRVQIKAQVVKPEKKKDEPNDSEGDWIEMRGDFGPAGKPVLAFRLL